MSYATALSHKPLLRTGSACWQGPLTLIVSAFIEVCFRHFQPSPSICVRFLPRNLSLVSPSESAVCSDHGTNAYEESYERGRLRPRERPRASNALPRLTLAGSQTLLSRGVTSDASLQLTMNCHVLVAFLLETAAHRTCVLALIS